MKRIIPALIFLLSLGVIPSRAQVTKSVTVTSTTSSVSASASGFFATLCENSATPTAIFNVTPLGSTTAVTVAAGGCYTFTRAAGFPFVSGDVIGTVASTTSGPFTFVLTQYPNTPAISGGAVQPTTCQANYAITAIKPDGSITCGAVGSAGGVTLVASGTSALGTSAIGSGACATVVTATATGALTTDDMIADFNADPTATTGYVPGTMLTVVKYITANTVNFKVCNNTNASITPSAVTLNWRVIR